MLNDIQTILQVSGNGEEDTETRQEALEDLQMHCEDLDLANGWYRSRSLHFKTIHLARKECRKFSVVLKWEDVF